MRVLFGAADELGVSCSAGEAFDLKTRAPVPEASAPQPGRGLTSFCGSVARRKADPGVSHRVCGVSRHPGVSDLARAQRLSAARKTERRRRVSFNSSGEQRPFAASFQPSSSKPPTNSSELEDATVAPTRAAASRTANGASPMWGLAGCLGSQNFEQAGRGTGWMRGQHDEECARRALHHHWAAVPLARRTSNVQ
jgi:hypothetical protein